MKMDLKQIKDYWNTYIDHTKKSEKDPYELCPILKTESFLLRLVNEKDAKDLLLCYGDKEAVKYMNADNCDDDFYYPTLERMEQAIRYWLNFYKQSAFIRFAIIDRKTNHSVGTVEIFGGDCGVLRIDLRKEYEKEQYLTELYKIAEDTFFSMLPLKRMVTKAIKEAAERRTSMDKLGWNFIDQFRTYADYYECPR